MELAEIILDWCSSKNDSSWSLQDPEHGRCLVVGRFESVSCSILSKKRDSSAHELRAFIGNNKPDGWTKRGCIKRKSQMTDYTYLQ